MFLYSVNMVDKVKSNIQTTIKKQMNSMKTRDKVYVLIADDDNVGTAREEPTRVCNTEYLRKDFVVDFLRDQLKAWVDVYHMERLIDKLEEV